MTSRPVGNLKDSVASTELTNSPCAHITASPQSAPVRCNTEGSEMKPTHELTPFNQRLLDFQLSPSGPLTRSHSSLTCAKEDEIARLRAELSACSLLEALRQHSLSPRKQSSCDTRQSDFSDPLAAELDNVTKALAGSRETISELEAEVKRLKEKVGVLETEVDAEKEHAQSEKGRLLAAMKQLIEAKSDCERELQCLHKAAKQCREERDRAEAALREQLREAVAENARLIERLSVSTSCDDASEALQQRQAACELLMRDVEAREERVKRASEELAHERADQFRTNNLLLQENDMLQMENETLKSQLQYLSRYLTESFMLSPSTHKAAKPPVVPELRLSLKASPKEPLTKSSDCVCLLM